jgi:hypothetical protein
MRMGLFWGILVVLIGVAIIVNVVFGMHLPIFQVALGLCIIALGLRILLGGWWTWPKVHAPEEEVVLHQRTVTGLPAGGGKYTAVFGKLVLDLRGLQLQEARTHLQVDAVFSSVEIWVSPDLPLKVAGNAAFGAVELPANSAEGFGETTYASPAFRPDAKHLEITANAVFAGIEVKVK